MVCASRLALVLVVASLGAAAQVAPGRVPASTPTEARQPGSAYMSPQLQALQRDDTLNPGQLGVGEGESLWLRPSPVNGRRCIDCHAPGTMSRVAAQAPAFDAALGRPVNLAGRVDRCRRTHLQLAPQGPEGAEVLALTAWLAHQARGQPLQAPDDPRLQPWLDRGAQRWQQRLGQLNLSCAQCHDQRAGQRLAGAPIPQAHPTGYPSYRLEWQGLGSLQRRLRGCLVGVRAEPFAADSDEWVALELYLVQRAAGMPMEGVSVRP
jgi:L-cysteine S-thiosulfotransferase